MPRFSGECDDYEVWGNYCQLVREDVTRPSGEGRYVWAGSTVASVASAASPASAAASFMVVASTL